MAHLSSTLVRPRLAQVIEISHVGRLKSPADQQRQMYYHAPDANTLKTSEPIWQALSKAASQLPQVSLSFPPHKNPIP